MTGHAAGRPRPRKGSRSLRAGFERALTYSQRRHGGFFPAVPPRCLWGDPRRVTVFGKTGTNQVDGERPFPRETAAWPC